VERSATYGQPPQKNISPAWGEIINQYNHNLALAGLWGVGDFDPAVALRFTAGYAHLVPCGTLRQPFAEGFSGIPERQSGIPERQSGIPERQSGISEYQSGIPEYQSGVPEYLSATVVLIAYRQAIMGESPSANDCLPCQLFC
jgi:hypothetical protein